MNGTDNISNLFFELLRVAVGHAASLSATPDEESWRELFAIAGRQTLVGVCFAGIEKLPAAQRPARQHLMEWFGLTGQIEERNRTLNVRSVETCRYFESKGFDACVLKGQGNAALYPWPLRRQSGDIDVWVRPHPRQMEHPSSSEEAYSIRRSRVELLRWARERYPDEEYDLKHIHFPVIKDVAMELHFVPSHLRSPIANRRLLRFYEQSALEQMSHGVRLDGVEAELGLLTCPTVEFNLVFQLTHIFNHFLSEGVGLRQVMDYYFLLVSPQSPASPPPPLQEERGERMRDDGVKGEDKKRKAAVREIKGLGLYGFAQALMWVLYEVLGMPEARLLVPMDEKRGRVLLDEILAGGNFGHYESRYWYSGMSRWKFYVARMRRMAHFLRYYPGEVVWDVPFRIWQRLWIWWQRVKSSFHS